MSNKYSIKPTDYGLKLEILGFMEPEEAASMNRELEAAVSKLDEGFALVVDMRANRAFSNEVAELMKEQVGICLDGGMSRAGVVLQSAIMTLQARRVVAETGTAEKIRFIDASADVDWEKTAEDWVVRSVEPPARATGAA